MIRPNASLPPTVDGEIDGEGLVAVARSLAEAGPMLTAIPADELISSWHRSIAFLRDRSTAEGNRVRSALSRSAGLSPEGLEAALDVMLTGVTGEVAEKLLRRPMPQPANGTVVVLLASNLPALAVQPTLAALAARRPLLLKSSSGEPYFAPILVDTLCRVLPALRPVLAAVTWPGGDRSVEDPLFAEVRKIVAYGGRDMVVDLERRARTRLVTLGPKLSFAVVDATDPALDLATTARGLARDIALFDQRGCLSIQAIFAGTGTDGGAEAVRRLAEALADELELLAAIMPPGPIADGEATAVHRLRAVTEMAGRFVGPTSIASGTVMVETRDASLELSPGLRTVRIYPIDDLASLPVRLAAWRGAVQGVALAGSGAERLTSMLRALGISRISAPGVLQHADAAWANGGLDPIEMMS